MRIGITYDLKEEYLAEGYSEEAVAEFDRPDTIEAIEHTLRASGYSTDRIGNIRQLVARLAAGDRWDLVFNIAEGLHGFGREAQVPALLEAYGIPYTFSDPMVLSLTLHKAMTKHVLRDCGIATPPFKLVEFMEDLDGLTLPYPLFAKPVAQGTGIGITAASRIESLPDLMRVCRDLLQRYSQPVLVETYLPGREFTVGIVGTGCKAKVLGVMEVIFNEAAEAFGYTYDNKAHFEGRVEYRLVESQPLVRRLGDLALKAWRALGCRDAGRLDLRMDEHDEPQLIELNPLAGLNPTISDLAILCRLSGISYSRLIEDIIHSALERCQPELSPLLQAGEHAA